MVYNPRKLYTFRKRFKYKIKYRATAKKIRLNVDAASIAIKSLTVGWIYPSNFEKLHITVKQKFKILKKKRSISWRKRRRFFFFFIKKKKKILFSLFFLKYLRNKRRKIRKRRLGIITTRILCYCPFTKKSKLVRMGKGKGKWFGWKAPIWCGSIFFQVCENGLISIPKNLKTMMIFGKLKGRISGRLELIILRSIK